MKNYSTLPLTADKKKIIDTKNETTVIAQNETQDDIELSKEESLFNKKVREVVSEIANTQESLTVDEVDMLLKQAQQDLTDQRKLNVTTANVDPSQLLNEVESELERSFRDKVFDALGDNFNKIRTAVVERNN